MILLPLPPGGCATIPSSVLFLQSGLEKGEKLWKNKTQPFAFYSMFFDLQIST
jgi:hypothetical protein